MKTYDSYDSGWIGKIPSHWMTTKIKYTAAESHLLMEIGLNLTTCQMRALDI